MVMGLVFVLMAGLGAVAVALGAAVGGPQAIIPATAWLLWLAPVVMLGGGIVVLAGLLRRARANRLDARRQATEAVALSDQERRRLDDLLHDEATRR